MTVSVTPSGKYYVCIMAQVEADDLEKTNLSVGIDLGLKDFVITSDNDRYSSNKFIKKYSKNLATMQKHLSRKKKGSGSWNSQRIKVARIQEKIMSCRKDKLHKISIDLIRRYDVVCCEDLNVKGMVKKHKLAKSISDASWGAFVTMLEYKAKWYGKTLVKIDRFYPSSKTCHHCGYVKEDLPLKDREWTCPQCGELIDRDLNAAKNILDEGLRKISAGTVDYTDGGEVEHIARKYDIAVSTVHASYTSKMCPVCGCIEDENRPNQETFECIECGHKDNADFNAAKNIKNRVCVTVLRNLLLKQLDNGAFEPKKLKHEKVKEVLLSFRRNLQENARSECIESNAITFDYV